MTKAISRAPIGMGFLGALFINPSVERRLAWLVIARGSGIGYLL
jgi:hypothetical protein